MKMEPLKSGALRIQLNEEDMRQWGLTFSRMDAADTVTRRVLIRLLSIAEHRLDFRCEGGATVEALPLAEGCLLLVTPHRCPPLSKVTAPQIYAIRQADDLLQLREALNAVETTMPASSLYGWGEEYRLIVYDCFSPSHPVRHLLPEFAETVGEGVRTVAYVEEHGMPIAVGNALCRLTGREFH